MGTSNASKDFVQSLKDAPDLLTTSEASKLLRRSQQTLRVWAMKENGPIRPVRTGRGAPLLWRRTDIEALVEGISSV